MLRERVGCFVAGCFVETCDVRALCVLAGECLVGEQQGRGSMEETCEGTRSM